MSKTKDLPAKYLRLLKSKKDGEEASDPSPQTDMFASLSSPVTVNGPGGEITSILNLAEPDQEIQQWLRSKTPFAEFKQALRLFNIVNGSTDPQAMPAARLALTIIKGTSFDDKRDTCIVLVNQIRLGQHTGRMTLVHSPYHDKMDPTRDDPFAIKVVPEGYPEEKFVGYIPKAQETNRGFYKAITTGQFCGAHLIQAKKTLFKGSETEILTLVTGWTKPPTQ